MGVVDNAGAVTRDAETRRPDVVVVDWGLGADCAARVVADLMDDDDPVPVIVLGTTKDDARARSCEAAAHVTPGDHPDILLAALHRICPIQRSDSHD